MKTPLNALMVGIRLVTFLFCIASFSRTALALSETREVTPAFLLAHPQLFAVDVKRGKDGLVAFTIKHEPQKLAYLVAHLTVSHEGKLVLESSTPIFGRKTGNKFHFSILPQNISESTFSIANCGLAGSGEDAHPIPGCIDYEFRLLDFVPKEMLHSPTNK